MQWAYSEPISVLVFLLPGFVSASIFYSLTSHPRPSALDRFIQALIFNVIGQGVTAAFLLSLNLTREHPEWTNYHELVSSLLVAILLGLGAAIISNRDVLHEILRRLKVTRETSHPSEWYSAFSRHHDCYVVLHLNGERRLFGWPEEWPSRPEKGHFRIAEGEWLVGDRRFPAVGVSAILIPSEDVQMVEFLNVKLDQVSKD